MKNYEDMSDGELSFQVHLVWNNIPEGYATISTFDINNPSDIMPIAIENGISLIFIQRNVWEASDGGVKVAIHDENPYRAIAICFLKMKDTEK